MTFIFKRTKIETPLNVISYEIPEIQRIKNNKTVGDIYEEENRYYEMYGSYCPIGSITIAVNEVTGKQYLVDGQHRMAAYKELSVNYPERRMNVVVETWYYSEPEYTGVDPKGRPIQSVDPKGRSIESIETDGGYSLVEIISKKVNTCNPHPLAEMAVDEYKIIEQIDKYMRKEFSKYIKESVKCHIPSINMEKFRIKIKESNIIKKLNIKNGCDFIELFKEINKFYHDVHNNYIDKFKKWKIKDPHGNLDKIKRHENGNYLYIGLYTNYEWLDRILDSKLYNLEYTNMEHYSNTHRPKITDRVREMVWKIENGGVLEGICWCCKNELKYGDFECGHIIPVVLGGLSNCDNLKPICHDCNHTCGTMNLFEFKKQFIGIE